ncbi:hypothetical protein QYF61_002892 [Mycteria americana]|uniref:Uncharacterized protein n=1 Tax=Mycteria americana TaxID=33587 RepID=A0AAN7S3I2_MYCAM|nr:hypothetical protein QYF61_002892 [Mycteria americana]
MQTVVRSALFLMELIVVMDPAVIHHVFFSHEAMTVDMQSMNVILQSSALEILASVHQIFINKMGMPVILIRVVAIMVNARQEIISANISGDLSLQDLTNFVMKSLIQKAQKKETVERMETDGFSVANMMFSVAFYSVLILLEFHELVKFKEKLSQILFIIKDE